MRRKTKTSSSSNHSTVHTDDARIVVQEMIDSSAYLRTLHLHVHTLTI